MARGINKVILVGNLGADPEVRYMPSGGAVANLSVATSDTWKDKQSGQPQERTEWHRVILFNRLGEIAGEYLKKGAKVYIEGRLQTRKWQDKNGVDRYTTEIIGNDLQMLDSRGSGIGAGGSSFDSNMSNMNMMDSGSNMGNMGYSPSNNNSSSHSMAEPAMDSNFDDDIPF